MTHLFPETVASVRLGFGRFSHFQRALREGRIPKPDIVLPDGPRWSEDTIKRWISGAIDRPAIEDEAQAVINALGREGWKRRGIS